MTRLLQWLIFFILLILLFHHVLPSWFRDLLHDDNYTHGLLIPFVSLYFIKVRWSKIKDSPSEPFIPAVLILVAGLGILILGHIGGELFSQRFSLVIVLYGLVLFMEGKERARLFRFPIGILLFAIPLPYVFYNTVAFPLKLIAGRISSRLLDFYGLPVFREGNIINLPHITLEVVNACSGIRSLMTLFALAFFLAYLMHDSLIKRSLILIMVLPIAVIANAVRVAITGVLTCYDPAWGMGFRHEFSGWLVFVFSFLTLGGISWLLSIGKGKKEETEE